MFVYIYIFRLSDSFIVLAVTKLNFFDILRTEIM
jgi:hypothetical protein